MRKLTEDEVRQLLDKCLENSEQLVEEAWLLYKNGRFARATALAIIALEEQGKRFTLSRAVNFRTDQEWKDFWRRFRRHEVKIQSAMLIPPYVEASDANKFDEIYSIAKQTGMFTGTPEAALYVDLIQGQPHGPSDTFSKTLAMGMITTAFKGLEFHRDRFPTGGIISLAKTFGNRKPGESLKEWMQRQFGEELPEPLLRMVETFDQEEAK